MLKTFHGKVRKLLELQETLNTVLPEYLEKLLIQLDFNDFHSNSHLMGGNVNNLMHTNYNNYNSNNNNNNNNGSNINNHNNVGLFNEMTDLPIQPKPFAMFLKERKEQESDDNNEYGNNYNNNNNNNVKNQPKTHKNVFSRLGSRNNKYASKNNNINNNNDIFKKHEISSKNTDNLFGNGMGIGIGMGGSSNQFPSFIFFLCVFFFCFVF